MVARKALIARTPSFARYRRLGNNRAIRTFDYLSGGVPWKDRLPELTGGLRPINTAYLSAVE